MNYKSNTDASFNQTWLRSIRYLYYLVSLTILAATVYRFISILLSRPVLYPSGDQLIWIKNVLIPFRNGDIGLIEAITYEYNSLSHSHIPQLAWFIFNERVFNLNLRLDMVVGFCAAIASFLVLARYLIKSFGYTYTNCLSVVAISTIIFSTGNGTMFSWSILLFQFVGVFIAFMFLYKLPTLLQSSFWKLALSSTAVLLFSGPVGIAAVFSSVVIMLLFAVSDKSRIVHTLAYFLYLTVAIILLGVLFDGGRVHSSTGVSEFLLFILETPSDFLQGGFNSLAQVFVHERGSKPTAYFAFLPSYIVGISVTLLAFGTLFYAARNWLFHSRVIQQEYTFPVALIITGLFLIGGTLKSRLPDYGVTYILAPRYFTNFSILGIGILICLNQWSASNRHGFSKILTPMLCIIVTFFNWNASAVVETSMGSVDKYINIRTEAIRNWQSVELQNVQTLIGGPCRNEQICYDDINYLQENGLSVFKNELNIEVIPKLKPEGE
ncbi:MAG: hypothetical protein ABJ275_04445 [Maricaulaceae bacterium]